ncbi:hypothetical protein D0B54_17680 [Solimonas sp. K1W22B-7]|uniref:hypothetical protein n=1 Tax=Solimonas sp. K1W22B-7 TaxID=2303331 RepID=UPI000E332C16|nr:hypothetical protein [Solimonas sp. K1W22B-7]AXQ30391.1 hypothetical protein D0B54_17680 [Solimonas sp. K1W22B-7]
MTLDDALDFCNDLSRMVRAWAVEPVKAMDQLTQIEQCFMLDLPADHYLVMKVSTAVAAVQGWLQAGLSQTQEPQQMRVAQHAIEALRVAIPESYDTQSRRASLAA